MTAEQLSLRYDSAVVPATFEPGAFRFADDPEPALRPGDRIRSRSHPELTGTVKHYEWTDATVRLISPIPYCIGWDDSPRAAHVLGFLFVYGRDSSVEPIPPVGAAA